MENEHQKAIDVLDIRMISLKAIARDREAKMQGCDSNASIKYWRESKAKVEAEINSISHSIEFLKAEPPF